MKKKAHKKNNVIDDKIVRKVKNRETYIIDINDVYCDFVVKVRKSGKMMIRMCNRKKDTQIWVYGPDMEWLTISGKFEKYGSICSPGNLDCGKWDRETEKFSGGFLYYVRKGRYYIRMSCTDGGNKDKRSMLKFIFPA